jgi:hypothetical protein
MNTLRLIVLIFISFSCLDGCSSKKAALQRATDDGYILGSSDSIKRQYWLKQALEKKKEGQTAEADKTKTYYYTFDGATNTEDGRKLVDQKVTVPVKE